MLLPSRLSATTLGDVLGALHRERVTGTLELEREFGATPRVHLWEGLVAFIEAPAGRRLGDILRESAASVPGFSVALERCALGASVRPLGRRLLEEQLVTADAMEDALRVQTRERLEWLFTLKEARLRFRVGYRPDQNTALSAGEFLHGRQRRRPAAGRWSTAGGGDTQQNAAWQLLGVPPNSEREQIRAAFRRRALALHPDRHGQADERERKRLNDEFVRLSDAYRSLVA